MMTNHMSATPIRRTLAATVLACVGLASAPALASVQTTDSDKSRVSNTARGSDGGARASGVSPLKGETMVVRIGSAGPEAMVVETPDARASFAAVPTLKQFTKTLLSSRVIVYADGGDVKSDIAGLTAHDASVQLGEGPASRDDVFVIETDTVRRAVEIADRISVMEGVGRAFVDHGLVGDTAAWIARLQSDLEVVQRRASRRAAPGIRPYVEADNDADPQGVLDPDLAAQWHFQNTAGIYTGRDNNISPFIYDTLGYDGSGVTIGIVRQPPPVGQGVTTEHFERVHPDLTTNFNEDLSQFVDLTLEPADRVLTAQVGLVGAERDNGINGHGIAPGARFVTLNQGTGLQYSQMLEHELDDVDIKVIPTGPRLSLTSDNFNRSHGNEFVGDSFENALRFGRGGRGTVLVFSSGFSVNSLNAAGINTGTGLTMSDPDGGMVLNVDDGENDKIPTFADPDNVARTLLFNPDYYDGAGANDIFDFSPPNPDFNFQNSFVVTEPGDASATDVTNAWTGGPSYVMAQSNYFPFASDWRTFLINAVSEDGSPDQSQAIGPAVFASVYTGTSNAFSFFDNPIGIPFLLQRPRGVVSTVPGGTETTFPPGSRIDELPNSSAIVNLADYVEATTNAASTAAGIIALMLDANPNLSIRDIQHILFESVFDSTRSIPIRFPNFDITAPYVLPSNDAPATTSFWQLSAAFRDTPSGTVNLRHSDVYGFGLIDAQLAVQKAETWTGAPSLVILDSGVITEESESGEEDFGQMPIEITDAEYVGEDPIFEINAGSFNEFYEFCVRPNIIIEAVEVELTITGDGSNDLFIDLTSPNGTRSNLLYPTTTNILGTSFDENLGDDESDNLAFNSQTPDEAFTNHTFTSFKHWGELSGGPWQLRFIDFGPDEVFEEGSADDPTTMDEDETEQITYLMGTFGVPGSAFRSEKEVVSIRMKFFGSESGEQPFLGCNPFFTSCPADLNGDGVVDTADLALFLTWFQNGDERADITNDGVLNFFDVQVYISIFEPGFCTTSGGDGGGPPNTGGRPSPFDDGPVVRPF